MKKTTANHILLLMAMLLLPFGAWADVINMNYEGMNYDVHTSADYGERGDGLQLSGAVLVSTKGKTGVITIPAYVPLYGKNYPVVGVSGNENTFYGHSGITKIVIPGTVRCMENNSLREMADLKELVFEDGTEDLWMGYAPGTIIDDEITYGSDNLNKVTLGRNMKWNTSEDEPFEAKDNLKTIVITPGCTYIGCPGTSVINRCLFNYCRYVESIRIEDSDTPLYVEYKGLYMKADAASRHQWSNVYVGRNVQYPGWDDYTNRTANADCYSPFYKLGNESGKVTLGPKVTYASCYMFYDGYMSRIDCMADKISVGLGAFGQGVHSSSLTTEGKFFNDVDLIHPIYDEYDLIGSTIKTLTVKEGCQNITYTFSHSKIGTLIIDPSTVHPQATLGGDALTCTEIGRFLCYRNLYAGTNVYTNDFYSTVKDELYLCGSCQTIEGHWFEIITYTPSTVIRIGKNVKNIKTYFCTYTPKIIHHDDQEEFMKKVAQPTFIFEAESKDQLPNIDEYIIGDCIISGWKVGVYDKLRRSPVYLHCSINTDELDHEKWNCLNFQKWHPEGYMKGTKDESTGLYHATCSGGCGKVDDSHWYIDKWNGTDDLIVNTVEGKSYFSYPDKLTLDDSKSFQNPVELHTTGLAYNRTVTGGNAETFILPFTLPHASCINGKVYKFQEFKDDYFYFQQLTNDEPVLAGTPYLVVPNANATNLIGSLDTDNILCATVKANGTAKDFSLTNGTTTQFGVFSSTQVQSSGSDTYYVYDSGLKKYVKITDAVTIDPYRTYFKVTGNSTPDNVNVIITNTDGNITVLGGMFTATNTNFKGYTGSEYTNAFDGNAASEWEGHLPLGNTGDPLILEFKAVMPVCISSYYFYTGNDVHGLTTGYICNFKSWTLSARFSESDDWEVISHVEDASLPMTGTTKSDDYNVSSEHSFNKYQFFKFEFHEMVKGNEFKVGEICLNASEIDINDITAEGEEEMAGGKRSGRVSSVDPVTVNGVTYTLYKDYYYVPVEDGVAQTELKRGVPGLSCVLTNCTAEGSLDISTSVDFVVSGRKAAISVVALGEGMLGYGENKVTSLTIPNTIVLAEKFALEDRTSEQPLDASKLTTLCIKNAEQPLFMYRGNGSNGALGMDAALQDVYIDRTLENYDPQASVFAGSAPANLSVTFNNAMNEIPACLFKNASILKDIQLPSNLTAIPESLCEGCTGLTTVEIPSNVTVIGKKAFAGCTSMTTYTLLSIDAPVIDEEEGIPTLSGTDDYEIVLPHGTVGAYLTHEDWQAYEDHIVKPEEKEGLYHPAAEATFTSFGYKQNCWEDTETGKLYGDPWLTMELDPFFVLLYPKYEQTLVKYTSEKVTTYESKEYEGKMFYHGAETTYADFKDTGERSVQFEVKHDFPTKARLVWYNDRQGYYQYGPFTITVSVNDEKVQEIIQDEQTILEGFFIVPLKNLKKGDVVEFRVNKPRQAKWVGNPTFAACLEYFCNSLTCNENPDEEGVYYTTFYDSRSAYSIGDDVKAYTGSINEDKLILTPVADNIIPKGEAVIIRGTLSDIVLTPSDADGQKNVANVLKGSDVDIVVPANSFILSYGSNGLGFYRYSTTLPAHKAYLTLGGDGQQVKDIRMVFEDEETTGILDVNENMNMNKNATIYNVNGIRVTTFQKGINIVNGKKVFIK